MTGEGVPAGLGGGHHGHTTSGNQGGGHAHRPSWARASEEYRTRGSGRTGHDRTISGTSSILFEDDEEVHSEPAEQVRMQNLDKSKGKAHDVFSIVEGDDEGADDEDERPSNDGPNGYSSRAHLLSHNKNP